MKKILLIITLFALIGFKANAQATAVATTSANIVTPITLTKNIDMNFGNVAVGNTGGTVILTTNNTRTPSGGVTLPVVNGTVSSAKFTVTGFAGSTYAITLPTTVIISDGAGHEMTVNGFVCSPTPGGTNGLASILTAGTDFMYVGATLNVNSAQVAGLYDNATDLSITVNYN